MDTPASTVLRWSELDQRPLLPGVSAAVRMGSQLSVTLFLLEPHAMVPLHRHPNEEFGQVIEGSLELTAGSEEVSLHAGEAFVIPGEMPHSAVAGSNGCRLLECYAPPRNPDPAGRAEKAS